MTNRVRLIALVGSMGFLVGSPGWAQISPPAPPLPLPPLPLPPTGFPSPFTAPPTAVTPALAAIPFDVAGPSNQFNFDLFAWLEFVALNWPADATTCSARSDATILTDQQSRRVWETWKSETAVFVEDPATQRPSPWCAQSPLRVQFPRPLPTIGQAFGGPLVDQGGRFVRYEERLNRDEHEFILSRDLWSKAGQTRWLSHDSIVMPSGDSRPFFNRVGAMEVKAAWKVLTAAERQGGRFYSIRAFLTTGRDAAGLPITAVADVGLIGFHITHKSRTAPQWTWATFEHVDNLTSSLSRPGCQARVGCSLASSFFCPDGCCPDNCQTVTCTGATCTELGPYGRPANLPTQVERIQDVTRMQPPDRDAARLNATFQRLLAGTVWANYALVSNQWPSAPTVAGGRPVPPFLANVALETYNQGPDPQGSDGPVAYPARGYNPFSADVSSSCLKCHSVAVTAGQDRQGARASADFSFLLGKAR